MGITSQKPPDLRTPNEKAVELMNLIPLNSYWYKVNTFNKNKNYPLSSNNDFTPTNDIVTEHKYFNVYGYSSDRSGYVYNECVEIKYQNDSWQIHPNGSLYDFEMKDCVQITKEEFEKIEDNFIKIFSDIKGLGGTFGGKMILLNHIDNSDWPIGEEWNKLVDEYPHIVFIRRDTIPYSELKIGDKYIFYVTDNALRMGEISNIKDEKNFNVVDRQVTISQESENLFKESIDKRKLFVLVTELEKSILEKSDSDKYWIITDDEWNKINFIFDEIKMEMNKYMKCDLNNEEECINFQRKTRLEKII